MNAPLPSPPAKAEPRRLHIGASRLEYIARSPTAVTIAPSWTHLGDPPHFQAFYEKGTVLSWLKLLARRSRRLMSPEAGTDPALYERTTFDPWTFGENDTLAFGDNRFAFAYSEHFLEHLRFDVVVGLLRETHRVLSEGGVARFVVPDADYRTYESPEPVGYPGRKLAMRHPIKHKVRWNVYMLRSVLELVGFTAVPLVYCDENGEFVRRDPKAEYRNLGEVADPEFVFSLDYVQRGRSLIVDGFKRRPG